MQATQETIYIPPSQLCSYLKYTMDHMESAAAHIHGHLNHVGLVRRSKSFLGNFLASLMLWYGLRIHI